MIELIIFLLFAITLGIIAFIDIRTREVSNHFFWVLVPLALVNTYINFTSLTQFIISSVFSVGFVFLLSYLAHSLMMGGGDLKLLLVLALAYPINVFYILLLSCILFIVIFFFNKEDAPFVPYLFFSFVCVIGVGLLW